MRSKNIPCNDLEQLPIKWAVECSDAEALLTLNRGGIELTLVWNPVNQTGSPGTEIRNQGEYVSTYEAEK